MQQGRAKIVTTYLAPFRGEHLILSALVRGDYGLPCVTHGSDESDQSVKQALVKQLPNGSCVWMRLVADTSELGVIPGRRVVEHRLVTCDFTGYADGCILAKPDRLPSSLVDWQYSLVERVVKWRRAIETENAELGKQIGKNLDLNVRDGF